MILAITILLALLAGYVTLAIVVSVIRSTFFYGWRLDPNVFPAMLVTDAVALGFLGLLLK